jgi:anthranilate synthase/aminodeoxychorismate synthase-like glutamine amidotransferase
MILVLDNYDSFTYNLVHYIGESGQEVLVVRNDEITIEQINDLNPEKIVISPGPCTPKEAGISIELIKNATVPLLGVCLGHQAIGAAFGGNIIKAPEIFHGKLSEVEHNNENIFTGITWH